ncbi:MAG: thiol-disulfide oxidoreductase DCC family protein [Cytophagaceae bacterium]
MNLPEDKTIIFFDGVCKFCNGAVNFVIVRDRKNKFLFAPLQSSAGSDFLSSQKLSITDFDSVIVFRKGKVYKRSAAALQVTSQLGFPWNLLTVFWIIPRFLRDFFYDLIARYRYVLFGKKDACMMPTQEIKAKFLE